MIGARATTIMRAPFCATARANSVTRSSGVVRWPSASWSVAQARTITDETAKAMTWLCIDQVSGFVPPALAVGRCSQGLANPVHGKVRGEMVCDEFVGVKGFGEGAGRSMCSGQCAALRLRDRSDEYAAGR